MTTFNADPRVRDKEPDSTALGPNFPGSINDLWRMVFRPSQAFLRYVTMAITNDDGSRVTAELERKVDNLTLQVGVMNALLGTEGGQMVQVAKARTPFAMTSPRVFPTSLFTPPGIGPGAAYADLDIIGQVGVLTGLPQSGIIQSATYHDLDDEGLQVDLILFTSQPGSLGADNAPLTLADADNTKVLDRIQFVGFLDGASGQVSTQNGLSIAYNLGETNGEPNDKLWFAVQARGALNIAAGSMPQFRLRILPDA